MATKRGAKKRLGPDPKQQKLSFQPHKANLNPEPTQSVLQTCDQDTTENSTKNSTELHQSDQKDPAKLEKRDFQEDWRNIFKAN